MRFDGQVVLVTGSTRGIGKAIAMAFAKEGATALIVGRNPALVEETAQSIVKDGGKADGFVCDVTVVNQVQETVNKILDKHKCIDILVNNAGVTRDNLLLRLSESDWDEVINVQEGQDHQYRFDHWDYR
jgi:3-oxoacyl-[acyl-carrier protein] reductase